MQVTIKELMESPRAWLKLINHGTDAHRLVFALLRGGVLLCVAALVQGLYYQVNLPDLANMQVYTAQTERAQTMNPRIYTLDLRIGEHLQSIRGACGGFHHAESNFQGGEVVRVWMDRGTIYQIRKVDGSLYQPSYTTPVCSLETTLDQAERRPQQFALVAMFGALVALLSGCRIQGILRRARRTGMTAGA
jgi:hypothetical protein